MTSAGADQQSATCPVRMNGPDNIAAHPSAIASLNLHLFLVIPFLPFLLTLALVSSGAGLSCVGVRSVRGPVSLMEPQHIKDIPGNVEKVTTVR